MTFFLLKNDKFQWFTITLVFTMASLLQSIKGISQEPTPILNIGTASYATDAKVSENGRYVLTLDNKLSNGTISLWDTRIGKTIKTFRTYNGISNFLPGDTSLLLFSDNLKLEIVSLFTKKVIASINLGVEISISEVSDDGKYIACSTSPSSATQKILIVDTRKKAIIRNLNTNYTASLLKFKRNTSQLYICYKTDYKYNSNTIYPYSIVSLNCENGIEGLIGRVSIKGDPFDISDNGKYILSSHEDNNKSTFLFSTESGNLVYKNETSSTGFFSRNDDYLYICHLSYLKDKKDYIYTPDDYYKGSEPKDENTYLSTIDIETGKSVAKERLDLRYSSFYKPFLTKNEKYIILDSKELFDFPSKLHLFSAVQKQKYNKILNDLSGNFTSIIDDHGTFSLPVGKNAPDEPTIYFNLKDASIKFILRHPASNILFTADSKYYFTESYNDQEFTLSRKDFLTGKEIEKYVFSSTYRANKISPNGKILFLTDYPSIIFYNLEKKEVIAKYKHNEFMLSNLSYSSCGNYITIRDTEKRITHVYDFNTGLPENFNVKKKIDRINFSQSDDLVVIKERDKSTIFIVNALTKKLLTTLNIQVDDNMPLQVSNTGLYLIANTNIYNVKTSSVIKENIFALDFTPDEKYVYDIPYAKRIVTFYDIGNSFNEHSDVIGGDEIKFIPNTTNYISLSQQGGIRIRNYLNDTHINLYVSSNNKEWIIMTHDGYWDSSVEGCELISMVEGDRAWNIDQFAVWNNRPDIILQRLGCTNNDLIQHYKSKFIKRLSKIGINEDSMSRGYQLPTATIRDAIQDKGQFIVNMTFSDYTELSRYNIFINDVPIFGSYGKVIKGKLVNIKESIQLCSGLNKIEVSCLNSHGIESLRDVYYTKFDDRPVRNLYFLAFGVSVYSNTALNLQYAHKDAFDLENVMRGLRGKGFENVYTKVFTNEQVVPNAIKEAKDFVKNAKPDDTFILFIAGHGMHDNDAEATYYFLTHNADLNDLKGSAVNFETIEDLLQGIPPRNKLFLMDACESGEFDKEDQGQLFAAATSAEMQSRGFKTLSQSHSQPQFKRTFLYQKDRYIYNDLVRRSGAIVFSSSKGGELSYERTDIENGLFTEYIMKALTTSEADKDNNGTVSTDELRLYVSEQVAKASGELQHPTVDRDNIYQKFGFGVR